MYQVQWDNDEKTTLHCQMEPGWDWNSFFDAVADSYMLIRTVRHKVDIIITGIDQTQPSGSIMHHLQSIRGNKPHNMGKLALVNAGKIMQATYDFYNLVSKTASLMIFAESLEDARVQLANERTAV